MKRCAISLAVAALVVANAVADNVLGPITGTDTVTVSADTELHGSAAPEGVLHITGGTLTVTTNGHEAVTLPDSLKSKLSLWLDATTNVVVDAERGGVVQWLDVRETPVADLSDLAQREANGNFTYVRAKALLDSSNPVFDAEPPKLVNFASLGGRPAVDFGEYQTDSRWLYFTTGAGTSQVRIDTTAFVGVLAFHDTFGFLFGDVTNLVAEGGIMLYHKSLASELAGRIANANEGSICLRSGEPRLNGLRIDPQNTSYLLHEQFQLFSNDGPAVENLPNFGVGHPFASVLFNGANFRKGSGSGKSSYDRQGGGIIAELLVFKRLLTDSERRQAEAYLAAKWFGVPVLGKVDIAEGASLAAGASATNTVVVSDLAGKGTVAKRGDGRMLVERAESLEEVALAIAGGTVEIGQKRDARLLAPVPGVALAVSPSKLTASANSPGRFTVTGTDASSAVLLQASDMNGTPIDLSGVKATVTLPLQHVYANSAVPMFSTSSNLLANGSFESPAIDSYSRFDAVATNAWFWDGGETDNKFAYYVRYGSAFRTNTTQKIDGNQALALSINSHTDKESARVSQYFDAPVAGIYTVRLWMSRRETRSESEGALMMTLLLDEEKFCTVVNQGDSRRNRNQFRKVCVDLPPMAAGRHKFTIAIPKNGNAADRSIIVDGVSLTLSHLGEFVKVANPGFESLTNKISLSNQVNGWFLNTLDQVEGWRFLTTDTGISQDSTWWSWGLSESGYEDADYRKAYIKKNGYVETDVVFPRDGTYRFSFRFSNRASDTTAAVGTRLKGHSLSISVNGSDIGKVSPVMQQQFTYAVSKDVTAGAKTLKIRCDAPSWDPTGDYSAIIDDVRIEYLKGVLTNGVTLNLSVNAPSNGFYFLSVPLCGLMPIYGVASSPRNNWVRYPARTSIALDGNEIGEVVVEKPEWTPFVFRLPYLAAGAHVVTIVGIASGSGSGAYRYVGECELLPLAFANAPARIDNLDMTLGDGAKLDLQFPGTLNATGRLKMNGMAITGEVSAQAFPQWVTGPGTLSVAGKGLVIMFK